MRILSAAFLLFHLTLTSNAQSLFVNTYGTPAAEERAFDMVILDDGSIITYGDRYDISTFERTGYLLKVDANGIEEWNRQLSSNGEIYGAAICKLPNGNVMVCGYDYDVTNVEFGLMVAEYNESNGLPVYQKTHEFGMSTAAVDMVPMSDNGAIILSTYETGTSFKTNLLCRVNSNGDTLWSKIVDPYSGNETPGALALVPDGLVIVGTVHGGSSDNVFIIRTDMDGNVQWEETHASSGIEIANDIAVIQSGGFYIAGITNAIGNGGLDLLGMKLDATGQHVWSRGFGSDETNLGYGVAVMPDGGAIFSGSGIASDTATFRDLILIRTDADGDTLWTRNYGSGGSDTGYEVQVNSDHIIAVGKSDISASEDVLILRVDLNGTVGIHEAQSAQNWKIHPNPFTNSITISPKKALNHQAGIEIFDAMGRSVLRTTLQNLLSLDLSSLKAGMYLISIEHQGQWSFTRLLKIR